MGSNAPVEASETAPSPARTGRTGPRDDKSRTPSSLLRTPVIGARTASTRESGRTGRDPGRHTWHARRATEAAACMSTSALDGVPAESRDGKPIRSRWARRFLNRAVSDSTARRMPLTSLPPESACKPTPPTREPLTRVSENDARCQVDDHPPSASTAGASNVKGPFKRLRQASSLDGETTTPAPGPVPPVDVHRGCWWGHGLATTADSDDDEAVRSGAGPTPFSAARGASGGLAGDALARCKLCDGEFARDDVALLNGCNHPFCVPCVETWAARRARSCPTCKKDFDGWHYGEKIAGGNDDGGAVRWERRFYQLPPPTGERKPARSARALAFDPPPTFNDPEEDEDAAREMREAEARETETTEGAAVGKPETGMSGDVARENGTHLADTDVGDAEKDPDGTLGGSVKKRKRELPGESAGQNDE